MQDLTFGEQVKIVLSRKNMTIKELAKKIEIRTKKKMSRQNLTQRLGRDNFQEQDMRMIAEILGCPFRLDILGDSLSAEKTEEPLTDAVRGQTEEISEKGLEQADHQTEVISEKGLEQADHRTEEISENSLEQADHQTEEAPERQPEGEAAGEGVKESEEAAPEESGNDETEGTGKDKTAAVSHERDITIGELVDIHKELDEMIERATGELPKLEEHLEEEHREEQPAQVYEPAGYDDPNQQIQTQQEELAGNDISAEEREPIEKLLEEIESMESEDKKEERQEEKPENQAEKPHGWRAYFMQRFKKKGKDQPVHNEEPRAENSIAEDVHTDGSHSENAYVESGYAESRYAESGYTENMYEETGYGESVYTENTYEETGYGENGYTENIYEETGYAESGYTEHAYPENGYAGMYAEDSQSVEYAKDPYAETGYLQEAPQEEEEEEKGERNPYTGKEYETNSVRMHPSRIGYVQVYDRSNHEWTDMTEWAFLGYQERKKQLLGKDYDPPIYLD